MTPQEAEDVLDRYVVEQCTQEEKNLVDSWLLKLIREAPPIDWSKVDMTKAKMWKDYNKLMAEARSRFPERFVKNSHNTNNGANSKS
jgi:hypothetical protein